MQQTAKPAVEIVTFANRAFPSVRIVRGAPPSLGAHFPAMPDARMPRPRPAKLLEIVLYGEAPKTDVAVVHGDARPDLTVDSSEMLRRAVAGSVETVRFANSRLPAVAVVRGPAIAAVSYETGLFPITGDDLDRVAFAVDGAESSHGTNPAMWRESLHGPQGPMQVSAAAALDVGGGDRFDIGQNRLLGRAYLARMYQRYGNWPDAVAAYNWGPGNMDLWITSGRPADHLPPETGRYVHRVLRDVLLPPRGVARTL